MEKEGNKNEKGGAKKRWLAFFDYFKIIFNLIFLQFFLRKGRKVGFLSPKKRV